jgi:hypothetical protein
MNLVNHAFGIITQLHDLLIDEGTASSVEAK